MIVESGHFALILALMVALAQFVVPLWGSYRKSPDLMRFAVPAAQTQFMLLAISFGALVWAFAHSDFSVMNVYANSHSAKPLFFKISASWASHEGSMLLWILLLSFFGALVATFGNNLPPSLKARVLGVQASVSVAFLAFIIFTSNPFERIPNPPMEGRGLNPILQDFALAIHPPFLYAGYVGFSVAFSFAVAALIEGRVDATWARWVRPWTLLAWVFLTLGIALGSWWAYYELGWGGWWFWDPVENASLMPWLAGTALLHSALVVEKREALKLWTIILSIMTFSLSLMGTFIVRSGVLSSVHAFAVDPERGVFILAILAFFTGGSLALYAWRAPSLKQGGLFAPISREGSLVLNNLFLVVGCSIVLLGTLWPLVREAFGDKISVGWPWFQTYFGPLMIPLLIATPAGPFLAWKRGNLKRAIERLRPAILFGLGIALFTYIVTRRSGHYIAPLMVGLGAYVAAGAILDLLGRVRALDGAKMDEVLRRMRNLPRSGWGTVLGHLGVGIFAIGVVCSTSWKSEKVLAMDPGEKIVFAGFELVFNGVNERKGPDYSEKVGAFDLLSKGHLLRRMEASRRNYVDSAMPTTETAIYHAWSGDFYLAIGDALKGGRYTVRIYFNPFVRFIWLGCLLMALGGLSSLSDRRLRVGAPKRAARAKKGRRLGPSPAE